MMKNVNNQETVVFKESQEEALEFEEHVEDAMKRSILLVKK